MVGSACGLDHSSDFLLAQNDRQSLGTFRINQIDLAVWSSEYLHEKETDRRNTTDDRSDGEFAIIDEATDTDADASDSAWLGSCRNIARNPRRRRDTVG